MCKLYQVGGIDPPPHFSLSDKGNGNYYNVFFLFCAALHDLMPSYNALPSNERIGFLYQSEVWKVQTS
jgi:hypothetical protein